MARCAQGDLCDCPEGDVCLGFPQKSKDEPFGHQLQPVRVTISGGEAEDRSYWTNRIKGYLAHQPCAVNEFPTTKPEQAFIIYPDANND